MFLFLFPVLSFKSKLSFIYFISVATYHRSVSLKSAKKMIWSVLTLLVVSQKADYRFLSYYTHFMSTESNALSENENVMDMTVQILKLCPLPFFLHFFGTPCIIVLYVKFWKNMLLQKRCDVLSNSSSQIYHYHRVRDSHSIKQPTKYDY